METSNLIKSNLQPPTSTQPTVVKDPAQILKLFREFIAQQHPEFIIDKKNESAINYLAEIAAGTADKSGIILHGNPGTGKTALLLLWFSFRMRVFEKYVPTYYKSELKKANLCYYTMSLLRRVFEQGGNGMFMTYLGDVLFLDDVSEMTEGNHFGTRVNLISEIIYKRYNQWKYYPYMETYMTTNLLSGELEKLIGQRAFSRLEEMTEWNAGTVAGSDRRKQPGVLRTWPKLELYDPLDKYL